MNYFKKLFYKYYFKIRPPEMVRYGQKGDGSARAKVVKDKDGSVKMEIEGEKYLFPGFPRGHVLFNQLDRFKKSTKEYVFHTIYRLAKGQKLDLSNPFIKELARMFDMITEAEVTVDMRDRMQMLKTGICYFLNKNDSIIGNILKNRAKDIMVKHIYEAIPDMLPEEQLVVAVREMGRVFDLMIAREPDYKMKDEWTKIKKGLLFFFEEDDAYRFRTQWFIEKLDMRKVRIADPGEKWFTPDDYRSRLQWFLMNLDIKKVKLSKADIYYFRGKWFRPDYPLREY
jgi:hypothetical protein